MIADISKHNQRLGTLNFGDDGKLTFEGEIDRELAAFVKQSLERGITRSKDIRKGTAQVIVEEPISSDNQLFPLAFIEWLSSHGYDVTVRHPEVDQEIEKLLGNIPDTPDTHELKDKIRAELPSMNYLEKTFILEKLKEKLMPHE